MAILGLHVTLSSVPERLHAMTTVDNRLRLVAYGDNPTTLDNIQLWQHTQVVLFHF
jgi:hypothetical protein